MTDVLPSLWRGLCPRCRQTRIFSRLLQMNPRCSACGLVFDREPGYFLGAMIVSYIVSVLFYWGVYQILKHALGHGFHRLLAETTLLYLPFIPFVFRYS